jgi:hypothetical protein
MYSYHALVLLAEARRADMLREAQPQLRPVPPKRERTASIRAMARWPRRRRASHTGLPAKIEPSTSPMPATTSRPDG